MTIHHVRLLDRHPVLPVPSYLSHIGHLDIAYPPSENCQMWFTQRSTDVILGDMLVTGRSIETPEYVEKEGICPSLFKTIESVPRMYGNAPAYVERIFFKGTNKHYPYKIKYHVPNNRLEQYNLLYLPGLSEFRGERAYHPLVAAMHHIYEQTSSRDASVASRMLQSTVAGIVAEQTTSAYDISVNVNRFTLNLQSVLIDRHHIRDHLPEMLDKDYLTLAHTNGWDREIFLTHETKASIVNDFSSLNLDFLQDKFVETSPSFNAIALEIDHLPLTDISFEYTLLNGRSDIYITGAMNRLFAKLTRLPINFDYIKRQFNATLTAWVESTYGSKIDIKIKIIKTFDDEMFVICEPQHINHPSRIVYTDIALLHLCGYGAVFM